MAIAHDVTTTAAAYTATGTQTTSHVASASARAAVVLIDQNGSTANQVSGVTYGGVAMTRLRFNTEATETGGVYIYWLDNVATGTQNVAMTTTGTANKQLSVSTMTVAAGKIVTVGGHNSGTSASSANPSWTVTGLTAGIATQSYEVIHSGLTTMTNTPAAGWTLISSTDLGAQGRGFARLFTASSGTSLTCGWTAATADDWVGASVVFIESVNNKNSIVAGTITVTGSITATGQRNSTSLATVTVNGSAMAKGNRNSTSIATVTVNDSVIATGQRNSTISGTSTITGSVVAYNPEAVLEVVVVAGGGGGQNGGGGAGGLVHQVNRPFVRDTTYTVTVGDGGLGRPVNTGAALANGGNSVFDTITAIGGGSASISAGTNGGSGSGGYSQIDYFGTATQGNSGGGTGFGNNGSGGGNGWAGGGGGAGEPAPPYYPSGDVNQVGGDGLEYWDENGNPTYYAGGGGGRSYGGSIPYAGGLGGGGLGNSTDGTPNTGGGGGTSDGGVGDGGSGVVIIRVLLALQSSIATTGTVVTGTDATYAYFKFTTSGTFKVNTATRNSIVAGTSTVTGLVTVTAQRKSISSGMLTASATVAPNKGAISTTSGTLTVSGSITATAGKLSTTSGTNTVTGSVVASGQRNSISTATEIVTGLVSLTIEGGISTVNETEIVTGLVIATANRNSTIAETETVTGSVVANGGRLSTTSGTLTASGSIATSGERNSIVAGTQTASGLIYATAGKFGDVTSTETITGLITGTGGRYSLSEAVEVINFAITTTNNQTPTVTTPPSFSGGGGGGDYGSGGETYTRRLERLRLEALAAKDKEASAHSVSEIKFNMATRRRTIAEDDAEVYALLLETLSV